MIEFAREMVDNTRARFKSQLLGTYSAAFVFWNWKAWLWYFGDADSATKVKEIDAILQGYDYWAYPALIAASIVLGKPILDLGVFLWREFVRSVQARLWKKWTDPSRRAMFDLAIEERRQRTKIEGAWVSTGEQLLGALREHFGNVEALIERTPPLLKELDDIFSKDSEHAILIGKSREHGAGLQQMVQALSQGRAKILKIHSEAFDIKKVELNPAGTTK